jgi:exonuclease VII small subunit
MFEIVKCGFKSFTERRAKIIAINRSLENGNTVGKEELGYATKEFKGGMAMLKNIECQK